MTSRALRKLRDGEFAVDCAKAMAILEAIPSLPRSEEGRADYLRITRSSLRRILGKDGPCGIVKIGQATQFASACRCSPTAVAWHGSIIGHKLAPREITVCKPQKVRWVAGGVRGAGVLVRNADSDVEQFIA